MSTRPEVIDRAGAILLLFVLITIDQQVAILDPRGAPGVAVNKVQGFGKQLYMARVCLIEQPAVCDPQGAIEDADLFLVIRFGAQARFVP